MNAKFCALGQFCYIQLCVYLCQEYNLQAVVCIILFLFYVQIQWQKNTKFCIIWQYVGICVCVSYWWIDNCSAIRKFIRYCVTMLLGTFFILIYFSSSKAINFISFFFEHFIINSSLDTILLSFHHLLRINRTRHY